MVWSAMKARCNNKNVKEYKYYGGRGVKVCAEWHEFEQFYNWAINNGWENGAQLDKDVIPNKLNIPSLLYSPETCCFTSQKINVNNTRATIYVEYLGEKLPFQIACEKANVNPLMMRDRLRKQGLTFEEALKYKKKYSSGLSNYTSFDLRVYREVVSLRMTGLMYKEIAKKFGITVQTVYNVITNRGNRFDWLYVDMLSNIQIKIR